MSSENETGTQTLESSSDTIELRLRQEPEENTQGTETSVDELTFRSVDGRIKQPTDPILKRIEESCALIAGRTEMKSSGNSESSGSRRNNVPLAPHVIGTTLSKTLGSLAMTVRDHDCLVKMLPKSCQDLGKHIHALLQAYHDPLHWVASAILYEQTSKIFVYVLLQATIQINEAQTSGGGTNTATTDCAKRQYLAAFQHSSAEIKYDHRNFTIPPFITWYLSDASKYYNFLIHPLFNASYIMDSL